MTVKQVFNTSAELDYPTVLPTLDLDFANSKTLDPRITFTRASGGSYVGADGLIKYAGVNEARFDHDPATGESLGLLIEEERTNLVNRSEVFNTGSWFGGTIAQSGSVIANSSVAPDGTLTADKIIPGTSFNRHYLQYLLGVTANTTYTASCFAKAGEYNFASVIFGKSGTPFTRGGSIVNLTTGEITNYEVSGPISVIRHPPINYGNGWWKISVSVLFDSTSTDGYFEIGCSSLATNYSGNRGDNISGIYIWGAQLEVGSFASSYIPTQGSTRTRARDVAKMTGKNVTDFYNINESTILVEFIIRGMFATSAFNIVLELSQSGTSKLTTPLTLGSNSTNLYDGFVFDGVQYFEFNTIPHSYGEKSSYVIGLKENDSYRIAKISDRQEDISINTTVPLSKFFPNTLNIGSQFLTDSRQINGTISKITYYPKRLPNSQLQTLVS